MLQRGFLLKIQVKIDIHVEDTESMEASKTVTHTSFVFPWITSLEPPIFTRARKNAVSYSNCKTNAGSHFLYEAARVVTWYLIEPAICSFGETKAKVNQRKTIVLRA